MSLQLDNKQAAADAADSILSAANMFRGFVTAAAILKEYGSLENAIAESRRIAADATSERTKALDALNSAVADIDRAKSEAAAVVAIAQESADRTRADASQVVASMYEKAKVQAAGIKVAAEAEAQASVDRANAQIAKLTAEKQTIETTISVLESHAKKANAEAAESEKRLAAVRAAITSLK